jgi:hypothetical protein
VQQHHPTADHNLEQEALVSFDRLSNIPLPDLYGVHHRFSMCYEPCKKTVRPYLPELELENDIWEDLMFCPFKTLVDAVLRVVPELRNSPSRPWLFSLTIWDGLKRFWEGVVTSEHWELVAGSCTEVVDEYLGCLEAVNYDQKRLVLLGWHFIWVEYWKSERLHLLQAGSLPVTTDTNDSTSVFNAWTPMTAPVTTDTNDLLRTGEAVIRYCFGS